MKGLRDALLVFLGGGTGSVLRWLASLAVAPLPSPLLPWATLGVNLAGSFAIGFLAELVGSERLPREARLLLVTGLLGGFTTMSAFSLETAGYLRGGHAARASAYAVLTLAAGVALCMLGARLGKR